ncbi:Sec-independent protein translocase protein TatA [Corynebacterium atrinae]|uniref:Sec-independent protein translocase subunit TatA n=1 Tax=Corynebacterium atrinae TaxID=1336740 RepID=UPI0025B38327|nr:Sec-independent protein translocase subunit TatA [Corynebacterium atrinae]WJY63386.1 Sec-independent protein translocase protein TatA [Corynebacterium atrinae]
MPNLGLPEILIIAVLLVLLFGAKKLPDAARSIGRSMRIFKSEVKEMKNDDEPQQTPQGQITTGQQSYWDQPQNQPTPQAQHNPQQGNPPQQPQQ